MPRFISMLSISQCLYIIRGVPLILDIGVVNVETCRPLSNAFVELWMANATGAYAGYPTTLGGGGPGGPGGPPPSGSHSAGPRPTGGPGGGGPGGPSQPLVRNETFLRGGLATNVFGVVELKMIYTGFYQGRTPHIHTMVHTNYKKAANGYVCVPNALRVSTSDHYGTDRTLISHAGAVAHIGQFFFDESWNDKVFALPPYTYDTNNRTLNSQDSIFAQENADGNDAIVECAPPM
jgi:protocatechuate 3,4-dioxygenase beta subunit